MQTLTLLTAMFGAYEWQMEKQKGDFKIPLIFLLVPQMAGKKMNKKKRRIVIPFHLENFSKKIFLILSNRSKSNLLYGQASLFS